MTRRSQDAPAHFVDNGTTVTIDVHGCTIAGALRLVRRAVFEASWKGRTTVYVIHGMGSDDPTSSIRGALRKTLLAGDWADHVTGHLETGGGRTTISLPLGKTGNPQRISVRDLMK